MSHRRSTVHDLAALRLHPDGSRVPTSDAANLRRRLAPYSAKDARGNWIAKDAGGKPPKKHRRKPKKARAELCEDEDEGEAFDFTGIKQLGGHVGRADAPKDDAGPPENAESDESEEDVRRDDARAKKRRRFAEDLSFLDTPGASTSQDARISTRTPSVIPIESQSSVVVPLEPRVKILPPQPSIPSSDLLKCIHHFASMHYASAGQLSNVSREARMEKKRRREERLRSQSTSQSVEPTPAPHSDGDGAQGTDVDDDLEEDEDEEVETKASEDRTRRKIDRLLHARRDMYKVFDGSALMALGMLLQEHIASAVSFRQPSDEWVAEMETHKADASSEETKSAEHKRRHKKSSPQRGDAAAENLTSGTKAHKTNSRRKKQKHSHESESEEAQSSGASSKEESDAIHVGGDDNDSDDLFAHGTEDDYTSLANFDELESDDE